MPKFRNIQKCCNRNYMKKMLMTEPSFTKIYDLQNKISVIDVFLMFNLTTNFCLC